MLNKVGDDCAAFQVLDNCTRRNFDDHIHAASAVPVFTAPMFSAGCFEMTLVTEVHKRPQSFVDDENDISAFSTISTGRTAVGNILLAAKCNHSIPAVAAFNIYFNVIDKHVFSSYRPLIVNVHSLSCRIPLTSKSPSVCGNSIFPARAPSIFN